MKKPIIFILSIVFIYSSEANAFDHLHKAFTEILKRNVVVSGPASTVRYANLKSSPDSLNSYLKDLSSVKESEFKSWNENQQFSYLINAYNAYTLKLIINHYPVKSIKDIGGFFGSPWKKEFIPLFGKKVHLDHIERGLIRKDYKEPRIHFALVCAAIGCPKLQPFAYQPQKLDNQLEESAKEFLQDKSRNHYSKDENTFFLSSIFKWYGEDFGDKKDVKKFVAKGMGLSLSEKELKKAKLEYLDYDWKLNDAKPRGGQ